MGPRPTAFARRRRTRRPRANPQVPHRVTGATASANEARHSDLQAGWEPVNSLSSASGDGGFEAAAEVSDTLVVAIQFRGLQEVTQAGGQPGGANHASRQLDGLLAVFTCLIWFALQESRLG